mgnify:CR=1 FL=1
MLNSKNFFMKILKTILFVITVSLLFTFCAEKNSQRNFTNNELIGKWSQINNDKVFNIESIQLLKDSIAKIQLINSSQDKYLMGKWENGFEKKVKNLDIEINSDIIITYNPDGQNAGVLMLEISEENEKLIMSGYKLKFEKE